ncbi:MAG: HypC/HybG/HupF family hydrogenase formation chaperone [Bdellovibrio sp.]|nr:HypC/HybG/HupF family hydrogenase formation chaperone [Bdellovibrio sp.]
MCLCVPAKIIKICSDNKAIIDLKGIQKSIALDFVPEARENQYVLVHAGLAISVLEESEVEDYLKTWEKA